MANRTEPTMGVLEFGDALIRTRDLDPLYCGLVGADLPRDQLARYLLSYLCFYHVGSSAWISEGEGDEFWARMKIAARNDIGPRNFWEEGLPQLDRWPRAAERRHFRGQKCVDAVEWLSKRAPEWWVQSIVNPEYISAPIT